MEPAGEYDDENQRTDKTSQGNPTQKSLEDDYKGLMEKVPCSCKVNQWNDAMIRDLLSQNDIVRYYNSELLGVIGCYGEKPFMFVCCIERGGFVQRYRVAISSEVYEICTLHLPISCPQAIGNNPKGAFGRIEFIRGKQPAVKKIMKVSYPIEEYLNHQRLEKALGIIIPATEEEQNPLSVEEIVREYCLAKRAGLLGDGPLTLKQGQFDMIFYNDYAEFMMEECVSFRKHFQQTDTDERALQAIKDQMVHRVKHMHQNHLVHMDVKTDNFVYSHGKKSYYLIDYGLARAVTHGPGFLNYHENLSLTPNYSPAKHIQRCKMKDISSPIDLHYHDLYGLTESFAEIDLQQQKKISKDSNKQAQKKKIQNSAELSEKAIVQKLKIERAIVQRATVESLILDLSQVYSGRLTQPQVIPQIYSTLLADYFPEYRKTRLDEKDLPKHPDLLMRPVKLNFNRFDYNYPVVNEHKAEKLLNDTQQWIESQLEEDDTLRRLHMFGQSNRRTALLNRIRNKLYVKNGTYTSQNMIRLIDLFDKQILKPQTLEQVRIYYEKMVDWKRQKIVESPGEDHDLFQEIDQRQLYMAVLENNIGEREIDEMVRNQWGPLAPSEQEDRMDDDSFERKETVGPYLANSDQPQQREPYEIPSEDYRTVPYEELDPYQVGERGRSMSPSPTVYSSSDFLNMKPEKDRRQLCIYRLVKLFFSMNKPQKAEYFMRQLTNPKFVNDSLPLKFFIEERLYPPQKMVQLITDTLKKLKSEKPMNQALVSFFAACLQKHRNIGQLSLNSEISEASDIVSQHTLKEQGMRMYRSGRYQQAMVLFEQCAERIKLTSPRNDIYWYELKAWIGELLVLLNRKHEGLALLNRCIEAVKLAEGPRSRTLGFCYLRMGLAYKSCSNIRKADRESLNSAIHYFNVCMEALQDHREGAPVDYIYSLLKKGECYELLYYGFGKSKVPEDEEYLDRALGAFEEGLRFTVWGNLDHLYTKAVFELRLAQGNFNKGRWETAVRFFVGHFHSVQTLVTHLGRESDGAQEWLQPRQVLQKITYFWISYQGSNPSITMYADIQESLQSCLNRLTAFPDRLHIRKRKEVIKKEKLVKKYPVVAAKVLAIDIEILSREVPMTTPERIVHLLAMKMLMRLFLKAYKRVPEEDKPRLAGTLQHRRTRRR